MIINTKTKNKIVLPALCFIGCLYNAPVEAMNDLSEQLFEAAGQSSRRVKELIARGANVNAAYKEGDSPLHMAVFSQKLNAVNALLAADANPNAIRTHREFIETPLIRAAIQHNTDIIKALLHAGADVTIQNENGQTALDMARWSKAHKLEHQQDCKRQTEFDVAIDLLEKAQENLENEHDRQCEEQRRLVYGHPEFEK